MSVGRLISRLIIQSNVKARNRQFFLFYFLRKCLICMFLSFGKGIRNCKNKFLIKCLTLWLCSLYSTPKPKLIISINFVNRKKKSQKHCILQLDKNLSFSNIFWSLKYGTEHEAAVTETKYFKKLADTQRTIK